jgi:hypothetical protein
MQRPDADRTRLERSVRLVPLSRKYNPLSDPLTNTRNHLAAFWRQTLLSLRRGRLYRIPWHRIPVCILREAKLVFLFTIALFARGIR